MSQIGREDSPRAVRSNTLSASENAAHQHGSGYVVSGHIHNGDAFSRSVNIGASNFFVGTQETLGSNVQQIRPIQIEQLNFGYVVTVGCHKFAISSYKKVTKMIGKYLANPQETEKAWFANELKNLKRDHTK